MKSKFFFLAALFAVTILACKNESKPTENADSKTQTTATSANACRYGVKSSDVHVNWTAYKTTKRVGVKGTFNEVAINTASGTPNLNALIHATSFKIDTKTVNSNNEGRDAKLVTFFFQKMAGDMAITGNVKSVEGDNSKGKGVLAINMNGMSKDTPFEYDVKDRVMTIHAKINTDNWNGQDAIASINQACKEKHTGEDGVSKTWPDVSVDVVVPLIVECE